jgi:hypothetical protein
MRPGRLAVITTDGKKSLDIHRYIFCDLPFATFCDRPKQPGFLDRVEVPARAQHPAGPRWSGFAVLATPGVATKSHREHNRPLIGNASVDLLPGFVIVDRVA